MEPTCQSVILCTHAVGRTRWKLSIPSLFHRLSSIEISHDERLPAEELELMAGSTTFAEERGLAAGSMMASGEAPVARPACAACGGPQLLGRRRGQ
jgi:hypothetical protein